MTVTPGVSMGHEDLALLLVDGALGWVLPITIMIRQLGCRALEVHHLRPLST